MKKCKTLKETGEETGRWEDLFTGWKDEYCENGQSTEAIAIPSKFQCPVSQKE